MQVHQENGGETPAASLRTRPNERRVRILDDQTNLNRSRSSTASTGSNSRRHSMPAKPKQLASFAEDENEPPADAYYQHATQNTEDDEDQSWKAKSPSGSGWVVLKPDNDRSESAEPNLRRWAHPNFRYPQRTSQTCLKSLSCQSSLTVSSVIPTESLSLPLPLLIHSSFDPQVSIIRFPP
ncbi:hypothetical protein Pst134EB_010153 [Puccinia striiformis f. sp. tritici]|nr:hypothetical protein Pst134EB_010153 [Puccinia striiformis f. sp. tritici]